MHIRVGLKMVRRVIVSLSEEYVNVFRKGYGGCWFPAPTIQVGIKHSGKARGMHSYSASFYRDLNDPLPCSGRCSDPQALL